MKFSTKSPMLWVGIAIGLMLFVLAICIAGAELLHPILKK